MCRENELYDGLQHLHGILRERCIVVLEVTFYADESGIHDKQGEEKGAEVVSIAGYIATKAQWSTFTCRWLHALRNFKVTEPFHMSEFYRHDKGPYSEWSPTKRKELLATLINIARENTVRGFGVTIDTKGWKREFTDEMKGAPDFDHPYTFCSQLFFTRLLLNFLPEEFDPCIGHKETVALVFHNQTFLAPLTLLAYGLAKKIFDKEDRLRTITFGSDEHCPPIQAADLIAFYARRMKTRLGRIPYDEFEELLHQGGKLSLHYINEKQFSESVAKAIASRPT